MSTREDSPGAESFHSLEADVDVDERSLSSSAFDDAEFFSDTSYGDADAAPALMRASEDSAAAPSAGGAGRDGNDATPRAQKADAARRQQVPAVVEVVDELALLRGKLEALSSYASYDEQDDDDERKRSNDARRKVVDARPSRSDGEQYSSGGYLDSYSNSQQPRNPPPDRRRQRELSLTRAQKQTRNEAGYSTASDVGAERNATKTDSDSVVPFKLQLPDFSHGYTGSEAVQDRREKYTDYRSVTPESLFSDRQSNRSRSPILSDEFEHRLSKQIEFNADGYQSDQFERVSREADDIIRQISATLGDTVRSDVDRLKLTQEVDMDYPDLREDEDPIFQHRLSLEEAEMEFSPSPRESLSNLRTYPRRRLSFEQSGLETRYTAAELEDERTPSPNADGTRYLKDVSSMRRDSTIEKLESLLGSHAPEKTFLDTETMEEISTYGRIRKIKKQRSEDQRILEEFDRHFDLCFDDSGEEDEFVSINDAEDVADRAAGQIPEDFYTEMVQYEGPFGRPKQYEGAGRTISKTPLEKGLHASHIIPEDDTLTADKDLFDLRRSREVLDLVEATKQNMPIHMERRRSFYDELSDHIEPRRSLDGQCKTRALTPSNENVVLNLPKVRLQTQRSDESHADSDMLFVPIGMSKETSQSPSRDEGLRVNRAFYEELDISELEEKAKQQRSIPFEDSHIRVGTALEELSDRPKTPIKAWRAELNLRTGEKMYESERYGGKDRNPDYGEVFGHLPGRRWPQERHTYEAFERKSRRDHPGRGRPRDVPIRDKRLSQKQKFVDAPATTMTSAFSATVVESDSYGDVPPDAESRTATFPRKSEKRRRRASFQGTRADRPPSKDTSKDRFLRGMDSSRPELGSREEDQKHSLDWRTNIIQFPIGSSGPEGHPASFDDDQNPLQKVPSYELIDPSSRSQTNGVSVQGSSHHTRPRPGINSTNMPRTHSVESGEEWSQSGYFIKPPSRRARSRQSVASSLSTATDSFNVETVVSESADTKRTASLATGQFTDSNLLNMGPPQVPRRTRSISRSVNRLDQIAPKLQTTRTEAKRHSTEAVGFSPKPVAPCRSRSAGARRPTLGDDKTFHPTQDLPPSGLADLPVPAGDKKTQGQISSQAFPVETDKPVASLQASSTAEPNRKLVVMDTPPIDTKGSAGGDQESRDASVNAETLAVVPSDHKDYQKVVIKLRRGSGNDAALTKPVQSDNGVCDTPASAGVGGSVAARDSADVLHSAMAQDDVVDLPHSDDDDDDDMGSDEEISSMFTVTFKPGTKIAEIEETPVQSSKSSSRRSSNSGLEERYRARARRNQELLQKAVQGMDLDETRDLTEDEANPDVEFSEVTDHLREEPDSTLKRRRDESSLGAHSVPDVITQTERHKVPQDNETEQQVPNKATIEEAGKESGTTLAVKSKTEHKPGQGRESIRRTSTDSPHSTKKDRTYYSDTGETISTASHVTAIEKPKIEVIRSSSVESGYELVDTSGSGSKPRAPQRRRRSSATGSAARDSNSDLKILSQDKFGLVKPTYNDINEWARRALSSDDDAPSYQEDPHLERRFDETLDAIDRILSKTPREELEQPAEINRPSVSKYEELSNLRDVLRQKLQERQLARTKSEEERQDACDEETAHKSLQPVDGGENASAEPVITGVYLDGVLSAITSGDPLLNPISKDYEAIDQKEVGHGSNLIGDLIRGIRRSIDLSNHGGSPLKREESNDGASRGFFGDLMQKLQDKIEDIGGELRDYEIKKKRSLTAPSRQLSSDKDSYVPEAGRPKSSISGAFSDSGIPDGGRSPIRGHLGPPRMKTDYTTDSEISVDYEARYKRPFPRRRRTRDRIFNSSSDIPNSSTNEDFEPLFRPGVQRRRSQPLFASLDVPQPPKRTKSTSNLSSSSLIAPPLPPKRTRSELLMTPQAPRRTRSKEGLVREVPPPLPTKHTHEKVPVLPPIESATATLVSPDRWQKGRLVQHRQSVPVPADDAPERPESVGTTVTTSQMPTMSRERTTTAENSKCEEPSFSLGLTDVKNKPLSAGQSGQASRSTTTPDTSMSPRVGTTESTVANLNRDESDQVSTVEQVSPFQDAVSDLPWVPSTQVQQSKARSSSVAAVPATQRTASSTSPNQANQSPAIPAPRRRRRRDTDEDGDVFYNAYDMGTPDDAKLNTSLGAGKQRLASTERTPTEVRNPHKETFVTSTLSGYDMPPESRKPEIPRGKGGNGGNLPAEMATDTYKMPTESSIVSDHSLRKVEPLAKALLGEHSTSEVQSRQEANATVPALPRKADSRAAVTATGANAITGVYLPGISDVPYSPDVAMTILPDAAEKPLASERKASQDQVVSHMVRNESLGNTGIHIPSISFPVAEPIKYYDGHLDKSSKKQTKQDPYVREQYKLTNNAQIIGEEAGITGVFLPVTGFEGLLEGDQLKTLEQGLAPLAGQKKDSRPSANKEETLITQSTYPPGLGPQGAYLDRNTGRIVHTIAPPAEGIQSSAGVHDSEIKALKKQQPLAQEESILPSAGMPGMGPQGMYLDRETGQMVYSGSGPLESKIVVDYAQQGVPQPAPQGMPQNDILGLDSIQDRFDALMAQQIQPEQQSVTSSCQQPIYSKAVKPSKEEVPLPPAKVGKITTTTGSQRATGSVGDGLLSAPKISVSCGDLSDGGNEKGLLSRLIPTRTKKKKKPQFLKIDPEQLARLPTMRPATPEPASPTKKNFLTVEDPNAPPSSQEETAEGETFTRRLIRRGSNALMGLTGSFRRNRSPSYIEGALPAGSPYQSTVVDTTDGTAVDVREPSAPPARASPSILRSSQRGARGKSAEPTVASSEKSAKVQFISSPVHGRTLKSETKPVKAEVDPLDLEEPTGPMVIDVTPSRSDLAFPVHGRKLKLATEGIAQPIRPTEESYLFSQYTDTEEGVRGRIPDIDPRTQITGLGRGDEKRGRIDDEFERDIFIPKRPKPPISLTKMLKGAVTGKGLPWSSQLRGRAWARKRQDRMELRAGPNSLLGVMQVGAAGAESRSIFGEEAQRLRQAEDEARKPQKTGRAISLADLMDIRQSFRNEELARMVAGAPPDAVLAHVKASPYVDSVTMETVKKLLVPDFAKIRERLEERFRKKIPKERIEKNYQPFKFDRGVALPPEEPTYSREGPLRMDSVRNRIQPPDLIDSTVQALYGGLGLQGGPPYTGSTGGSNEAQPKPLDLTLPDHPAAVQRYDILATAVPDPPRSAHEVTREAAELASQSPPAPPIPPLVIPAAGRTHPPSAVAPAAAATESQSFTGVSDLFSSAAARKIDIPDPDVELCNRRASLILVNARELDLARPQRLNELTSVNVDIRRLRSKLPSYKRFMAAEV